MSGDFSMHALEQQANCFLNKFDPRKTGTFIRAYSEIDENLKNNITNFCVISLKKWIDTTQKNPAQGRSQVGFAARCLTLLLYKSSFLDIDTLLSENSELISSFGISSFTKDEYFEGRLERILNDAEFSSPDIDASNKLIISSQGLQVYKAANDNIVMCFELWHPQRDCLSFMFINIESLLIASDQKLLNSLYSDFQSNTFDRISSVAMNSFLRTGFFIERKKIIKDQVSNKEINLMIYGSAHFGHYILNTLAQLHRINKYLTSHTINNKIINIYLSNASNVTPDIINMAALSQAVSKNLKVILLKDFVIKANNDDKLCLDSSITFGICGCRIETDFGQFARPIISNNQNNGKNKASDSLLPPVENSIKICFGIRRGSRELINQADIYSRLALLLSTYFAKVSIVIDGMFDSPLSKVSTSAMLDLKKECETADLIREKIKTTGKPNILVESIVGNSFDDQIAKISDCNFVVAPLGSGFAKYQWLCDIPGIAFGPRNAIKSYNQYAKSLSRNGVGLNFNAAYISRNSIISPHDIVQEEFIIDEDSSSNYRGNFVLADETCDYIVDKIVKHFLK